MGDPERVPQTPPVVAMVEAPVVAIVEAKNESISGGLGQCVAEMVGARIFNEREQTRVDTVYGAVTTGTNWKFLSLTGTGLTIDLTEYLIDRPEKLLGILFWMVSSAKRGGA